MIKIICDSISDVPKEIIERYDVEVVPLTVIFNGIEYIDGIDINNKQFYKMLRESEVMPKTSQVTYAQFKDVFEKGLELYRAQQWKEAYAQFQLNAKKYNDYPSIIFMDRIKHFKKNPPPAEWDGVFVMKAK